MSEQVSRKLRLAELLGELKYFQGCSRSYRHVLQRAAQIGLGQPNQGRRPYASWLPHGLPSAAGAGPALGDLTSFTLDAILGTGRAGHRIAHSIRYNVRGCCHHD